MRELACTCGTCGLEPIDTCRCEFAATMRGEVLTELDKHDLSTEAARRTAAEAVRASLTARYGPKVLRQRLNLDAPVAGVVVAGLVALVVGYRVRAARRRRRSQTD